MVFQRVFWEFFKLSWIPRSFRGLYIVKFTGFNMSFRMYSNDFRSISKSFKAFENVSGDFEGFKWGSLKYKEASQAFSLLLMATQDISEAL